MKFRSTPYLFLFALCWLIGLTGFLRAEEKGDETKPQVSGLMVLANQYVFRGYELSKDSLVIQPSLTLGTRGVEIALWGNLDTNDRYTRSEKTNWNETDWTIAYTREWDPVKVTGGFIYYALDGVEDTQEWFVKVTGKTLLTPTLAIYRDIAHYPAWYINLGVSHSFPLSRSVTLEVSGSVGYQASDSDKIVKYDERALPTAERYRALHDGWLSAGLTIPVGKVFAFKPYVGWSFPLSEEAKRRIKGTGLSGKDNFWVVAVGLSAQF